MRIKFGSVITKGSGKLGGHVFTSNGSAAVLQTKGSARSKGKNYGLLGQGSISRFSSMWRELSIMERDSFVRTADKMKQTDALGNVVKMSGFNLFVKLNIHALMGNFDPVTTFAASSVVPITVNWSATLIPLYGFFGVTFDDNSLNDKTLLGYLALKTNSRIKTNSKMFVFAMGRDVLVNTWFMYISESKLLQSVTPADELYLRLCVVDDTGAVSLFSERKCTLSF